MKRLYDNRLSHYLHNKVMNFIYLRRNKQIFANLPKPTKKDGKIVLFLTVRTIVRSPQTYYEATIAHALEAAGFRVLMLHCDNVLSSCDGDTYVNLNKGQFLCGRCKENRNSLIKSLNLEFRSYREFITSERLEKINDLIYSSQKGIKELRNLVLHGVGVGQHAFSSVVKYFLTHSFDEENVEHVKVFKKKLYNACVSVELAHQLHNKYGDRIEHAVTVHGIYSTWGGFYDYFKSRNVDSTVYCLGIVNPGSISFNRNGLEWEMYYPDTWEKIKNRDLTHEELREVDEYINNRIVNNLGVDLQRHNQIVAGEKKRVLNHLNSKNYKNRYVLYTHLIWDSVLEKQSEVFSGFIDMFNKTVEYFLKHTDKQLIIKVHPAELVWEKGSYSMLDYIKTHFPELTDNIYILPPSTPVNSYEILNEQTVALTYIGSIGYELSVIGVPVLVGGDIHYLKEGGVGISISSLEQYYSLLDDPSIAFKDAKENIGLAKKWCYYFYYMLHFNLPIIGDRFGEIDWGQMKNLRSMLIDKESSLSQICRKIKDKTDITNTLNS